MRKNKTAFSLIEILISISILVVGIVGILALFPTSLHSAKMAIEDANANLIISSVYSALQAASQQVVHTNNPGDPVNGKLRFFFDGMDKNQMTFPLQGVFNASLAGKSFGIPAHRKKNAQGELTENPVKSPVNYNEYGVAEEDFCKLGQYEENNPNTPYNINFKNKEKLYNKTDPDEGQLKQYSFNIQISYPPVSEKSPKGLYDVAIRVNRGDRLIKKFYTQIMIPTGN